MSDTTDNQKVIERLSTGIPGLDRVFNGGLLKGGMYIIMGRPGSGKTILANQMCFHHVRSGGKAVYVTLLAESHSRLFDHLSSLDFFSRDELSTTISFVSGYNVLEKDGPDGLLKLLRQIVQGSDISLLVIDGLVSAQTMASSDMAFKKFIHELNVLTTLLGCTSLLLTNSVSREDTQLQPEHTMVDGLISLHERCSGSRAYRQLQVPKFRGSACLQGFHSFDISSEGITVHSRLESRGTRRATPAEHLQKKLPTGVGELDAMLGGGIPANSVSMVMGGPGTGKTTLGLQYLLAGAAAGEQTLIYSFYETPEELLRKSQFMGLGLADHIHQGVLARWNGGLEDDIDAIADEMLELVAEHRVNRMFIDGIGGFQQATVEPERMGRFYTALTSELRHRGVTTMYSLESSQMFGLETSVPVSGASAVAENVILLQAGPVGDEIRRELSILKVRESAHDTTIRDFELSSHGIVVGERRSSKGREQGGA